MSSDFDTSSALHRLEIAFADQLQETPKGGAALAVYRGEDCLLSLHGGEARSGNPWNERTSCLIWSASKGVASACTLHALQEQGVSLQTPVCSLWPGFAANGKEHITLAQLFSHRAGLAVINETGLAITDHEAVTAALASQVPNWDPASGVHGYGARTFGFLLDEIIRRTTGETLSDRWNRVFREPLALDLWFGVPTARLDDVADILPPRTPPPPSDFSRAFGDPNSLTRRALSNPGAMLTPSLMNTPDLRQASLPSLGAIATADSLARFYALLGTPNHLFTKETQQQMQTSLATGRDLVLQEQTSFSAGFMTNAHGVYGPSPSAFGHPGAGGSLAFADPELGLGFAFVPSAMHPGALPGARTRNLVQALYGTKDSA